MRVASGAQSLGRRRRLVNAAGRHIRRRRIGHTGACLRVPAALPRLYPSNRRDGARLLSSALVIAGIGLVRLDHPIGRVVFLAAGAVSLYWWRCYRRLDH